MAIELTAKEFKALSSETRTKILKMLKERNHTTTELSIKLDMSVTTIKQHMKTLQNYGFVEVIDEGRKWKYYKLTKKAKEMLNKKQEQNDVMIVLTATILIGFLAIGFIFNLFQETGKTQSKIEEMEKEDFKTLAVQEIQKCKADENQYKSAEIEEANKECEKYKEKEACENNTQTKCKWQQ